MQGEVWRLECNRLVAGAGGRGRGRADRGCAVDEFLTLVKIDGIDDRAGDTVLARGAGSSGVKWDMNKEGAGDNIMRGNIASHSGRIGGATTLAAGGASALIFQREGRWSPDVFCCRRERR